MAGNPYDMITGGKKPKKVLHKMEIEPTHNGKHIVTHKHHHGTHHPDEMHAVGGADELAAHIKDNPMSAVAPEMPSPEAAAAPAGPAGPAAPGAGAPPPAM